MDKTNLSQKYKSTRYFQTCDGIIFSIAKFEKGCQIVDLDNPMNSSCVIEFDINGERKPNKLNDDIFQVVVDGKKNAIIPSNYIKENIFR